MIKLDNHLPTVETDRPVIRHYGRPDLEGTGAFAYVVMPNGVHSVFLSYQDVSLMLFDITQGP